ncbi:MAG: efflux RND transporter periplasmic adaptor subunit [Planctomycetia bacterium]|nr:efflux RND transporter periplasmic adaptor subunit [Planctomycetia bacterium]
MNDSQPPTLVQEEPHTPPRRTDAANRRMPWRTWVLAGVSAVGLGALGYVFLPSLIGAHPSQSAAERGAQMRNYHDPDGQALSVNTVMPQRKTLVKSLEQPGSLRPWAQAELYAKVSGYIKRLARETATPDVSPGKSPPTVPLLAPPTASKTPLAQVASAMGVRGVPPWQPPLKDLGSAVKAGEVLVELDVPELHQDVTQKSSLLKQCEAELVQARTNLGLYEAAVTLQSKQLARIRELAAKRTVTDELVDEKQAELTVAQSRLANAHADIVVKEARVHVARDEVERAKILAAYTQIRAPFDGAIAYRTVDEGDFVQNASTGQSRPLLSIIDIHKVKVVLQVPEREAIFVQPEAEAEMRLDTREHWRLQGKVSRVSPSLDTQSRTRQVEIDLDNPTGKLLPGMYGEATVVLQKIENAQAIPATAVYSRRGENFIIQVIDGVAQRQKVRIRYDDGKELEVVKLIDGREIPLDGTEELIVSNKGEIAEGQRVKCSRLAAR